MKFYLFAFSVVAASSLWTLFAGNGAALASNGFTGSWCGNSRYAYMITDFPRNAIKQGMSEVTSVHYKFNGAQLVADRWGQTGTLGASGNKIHWSDGSVWERAIYGTQYCATFGSAAAPAPSYRNLTFISSTVPHPAPIGYVNVWTAMSNSSNVGHTCVSFKNERDVTATRVLFALSLRDHNGEIVDTGKIDRKGTFSPNVEIHGWHSIEEYSTGQGPRSYSDNCARWTPDNQAQAAAYPRVRSYTAYAERVEYADGATWTTSEGLSTPAP
jgi:hypothetical protein